MLRRSNPRCLIEVKFAAAEIGRLLPVPLQKKSGLLPTIDLMSVVDVKRGLIVPNRHPLLPPEHVTELTSLELIQVLRLVRGEAFVTFQSLILDRTGCITHTSLVL